MSCARTVRLSTGRFLLLGALLLLFAVLVWAAGLVVAAEDALATVYINGRVVDVNGDPCAGVTVDSFIWSEGDQQWWGAGVVQTEADGSYTREMLLSGTYRFNFRDDAGRYVSEWYNNASSIDGALDVVLNDGGSRTMNAVLERTGTIRGLVTDSQSGPLEGIEVDMFRYYGPNDWRGCGVVTTGADGTYEHNGLVPGRYEVLFRDPDGVYGEENYDDIVPGGSFTDLEVQPGQTVDANAALSLGVTISGFVTDSIGTPLTGIRVTAFRQNGMFWPGVRETTTDGGAYSLAGMAPGTYHIRFNEGDAVFLHEWWQGTHLDSLATDIVLAAGQSQDGVDAALEAPGHITGTVTAPGGGALGGMHVTIHPDRGNGQWWPPVAQTWTGGDGTYDVGGLTPGTYRVRFGDDAGLHVPEWYPDAASPDGATDVTVTSGSTTGSVDAELVAAGAIAGTVRNGGGAPLQGIVLHVNAWDGQFWRNTDVVAGTAADGSYLLGGLLPGTYRVSMHDQGGIYADEVWQDAATMSLGTDVPVSAGATSTVDPVLGPAGHIMGQVAGIQGQPLANITVMFSTWVDDQGGGHWEMYSGTQTASNGFFDQGGLLPGATLVQFHDQTWTYDTEFYDNARSQDQATQVIVNAGQTRGLGVINLDRLGSIAGRVTDGQGEPLPGIQVSFLRWDGQAQDWQGQGVVTTGQDGAYLKERVRPGIYRVDFSDLDGAYLGETYDDMPPDGQQGCTQVQVNDGQSVTGIDATLTRGASISGMVTDSVGAGLSGISVWAERQVLDQYGGGWQGVAGASTQSGAYELKGLPPGTYRVAFRDEAGTYVQEWWDDHYTEWAASTFDLQAGEARSGVNASLILAGHIAGTVTGDGAGPLPGVKVSVNAFNGQWYDWVADAFTDGDGVYDVGGLAPGAYRLSFQEQGTGFWASEWYADATNPDEGVDVTVEAGLTTAPVDAELASGGSISGTVRNEQGDPLAGVDVGAGLLRGEDWWDWMGSVQTAEDGTYRIGGLRPGTYQLQVNDWSGTYAAEVYADARNFGEGIDVPVVAGQDTGGIDPVLGLGGRIAGHVFDEGGQPLENIKLEFEAWVPGPDGHYEYYTETWTNPDGGFEMGGLVPGRTLVHVVDPSRGHASEYFEDAPTRQQALPVIVTGGQLTDIGGIFLGAPGGISGTVRNAAGDPMEGLTVVFALWNGEWYDAIQMDGPWPQTDAEGNYEMSGLQPGAYQVWVQDPSGTWLCESFPEVNVASGATTTGVDLTMRLGAWISGTVSDPGGNPLAGVAVSASYGDRGDGATTGADGSYVIGPLGPGTIVLQFLAPPASGLRTEWWDNRTGPEDAAGIELGWGDVLNFDAVLGPDSDVDPPETQASGWDDQWHASPVAVTFDAGDLGSGLATTEYRLDGGEWTFGGSVEVGAPSDHSMDGAHTVWYRSVDNVGNVETEKSVAVKIDTTGPALHGDNGDGWYRTAVTVNLDGTDAGEGTVTGVEYRLPGGDWVAGTSFTMRTWKRGGGSGEHLVEVRAVDGLGNASDPQQVTVRLDARPPRTTDDYDGLPHGDDVTVHFAIADPLSGGLGTYYSIDFGPWLAGSAVTIPALAGGGNDGSHVVRYFSVDIAGNVETVIRTCTVVIDTTG